MTLEDGQHVLAVQGHPRLGIISRPNSLRLLLGLTADPNMSALVQRKRPKIRVE